MPQIIDVPNYGQVEFPDGMSEKDIVAAIKKTAMGYNKKPEQFDPTEGMSGLDKFRAGAGKAFYDLARGAGQLVGLVDQKDIDEAKRIDAPLMKTGPAIAGDVATKILTTIPAMGIPGANTVAGAGLVGGLMGALDPVATGEDRLQNIGLGAIAGGGGQVLANGLGRAVRPVQTALQGQDAALAAKARQIMPLNAAQETGSKPLRWIDSALDNLPFTADKQAAQKLAQREAWQGQVMGKMGESSNYATPDILGNAYSRLGQQFRDLSARNNVTLGNDFLNTIAAIDASKTPFSKGIDDVVGKALDLASSGSISGKEYQTIRTSLTNASKGAWQQNPELGQALKTLRNALDDAANNSISAADKDAWNAVREQYKVLKTVEKATDSATGNISPKKLFNEMGRANPQGMRYGFGDQSMPDLARIGKQFVAESLPDSGTAQRSWYMNMLQNPSAGLGGLLGFMGGGAPGAIAGSVLGAGTPLAIQRALWSDAGKRYFSQGLLDPAIVERAAPYINATAVGGLLSN